MNTGRRTPSPFRSVALRAVIGSMVAMMVVGVFGYWRFIDAQAVNDAPSQGVSAVDTAPTAAERQQHRLELSAKISVMNERVAESEKQIQQLEDLQKSWNLVNQSEIRKRAAAERLEAAQRLHAEDVAELAALKEELQRSTQNLFGSPKIPAAESPAKNETLWPYLWKSWSLLWVWLGLGIVLYAAGPLLWVTKRSEGSASLSVGSRAPMP